jgi:MerR family transcriptional regulator/heat shock protein HspR
MFKKKSGNIKQEKTQEWAPEDEPKYTISVAAKLLNISTHALRLYEREGLIIPFKKPSGHRLFSDFDLERLKCIREMITERKFNLSGIVGMLSLIPCWEIINCSKKDRKNCAAYKANFGTCWSYQHKNNICATMDCRTCKIYKTYGRCSEIKKAIKISTHIV